LPPGEIPLRAPGIRVQLIHGTIWRHALLPRANGQRWSMQLGARTLENPGVNMTDQSDEAKVGGFGARLRKIGGSIVQNPIRTVQIVFFTLVAIIILQNLETTSIDVLFWSFAALPKLVLIFLSMIVGALAWELARRLKG
jgi:uncharacterized integral membrane protein